MARLPSPKFVAIFAAWICLTVFIRQTYFGGSTSHTAGGKRVKHGSAHGDALARDPESALRFKDIHSPKMGESVETQTDVVPDGYIPISVSVDSTEGQVQFCRLDMNRYHKNPSATPMFKDLIKVSGCHGSTLKRTITQVAEMPMVLYPTAFVFHQSRCGSTLTANILASDPENLVFSESAPPAMVALHCNGCSDDERVDMLRKIVKAMGNSRRHKRLFFKFQSANTPFMDLYKKAFPDVPWIYLFREPLEIMASHLPPTSVSGHRAAPCLRSKHHPPADLVKMLSATAASVSDEEYCAAHLNYLNHNALESLKNGLGLAVQYESLPGVLLDTVFPKHFDYHPSPAVKALMMEQASHYSKGRGKKSELVWEADAKRKQEQASDALKRWSNALMKPGYNALVAMAKEPVVQRHRRAGPHPVQSDNEKLKESAEQARLRMDLMHHQLAGKNPEADAQHAAKAVDGAATEQLAFHGEGVVNGSYVPLVIRLKQKGVDVEDLFEENHETYLPYPNLSTLEAVLTRWSPHEPDIPDIPGIAEGTLQRFDYSNLTQRAIADRLRYNEVPFMLYNVPEITEVAKKWSNDEYLISKFGDTPRRVTTSTTNHFMYFNKRRANAVKDYTPRTGMKEMRFAEWLDHAKAAEHEPLHSPHYYLQLNSVGPNKWIQDDITGFQAKRGFFIADQHQNRGINCRFGARGIIAEAHYDGGRNFVAMLRGAKRYVLLPPSECELLYLYPKGHPEGRHAKGDWAHLDLDTYPKLRNAKATEVVVRAGEVLYIPSYWFHYIISTGVSAQCNTRSGNANRGRKIIEQCGFY
eukprot:m.72897 g.72897  ORF g.72897 m.72897 type:complete len:811 (-) comp16115_c0_seq15:1474-3906(-)